MIRLFQIAVLGCFGLALTGCDSPEKSEPSLQNIKIRDLAPSDSNKQPGRQLLKTINFDVYVFEIPAGNISALDDVWQMLYARPLKFNDYEAFSANSFLVGFGQIQMWNKIRDLLLTANSRKIETVSLLLPDGQTDDLAIAELDNEKTIFYTSTKGSMEGVTLGPGELALRIKAEKIPGERGVCKMSALPVFPSPITSPIRQIEDFAKSGEFLFTPVGFELKMSPGDFVFLGPSRYVSDQITLSSLFFSKPERRAVVRTYLILCTRISD